VTVTVRLGPEPDVGEIIATLPDVFPEPAEHDDVLRLSVPVYPPSETTAVCIGFGLGTEVNEISFG